jgi:large subunit ribosomal protein L18
MRRHVRIRRRVSGTADRPRMAIMISNRRIYVQFIDDVRQHTMASAASPAGAGNPTVERAREVGRRAGAAALAAGIEQAVVDRGGFKFHGRVKALVEGAAEAGVRFGSFRAPTPAEPADVQA